MKEKHAALSTILENATGWKPEAVKLFLKNFKAKGQVDDQEDFLPLWGDQKILKEFIRYGLSTHHKDGITTEEFKIQYLAYLKGKEDPDYRRLNALLEKSYSTWTGGEREEVVRYLLRERGRLSKQPWVLWPSDEIHTSTEETIISDKGYTFSAEQFKKAFSLELKNGTEKVSAERKNLDGFVFEEDNSLDLLVLVYFGVNLLPDIKMHTRSERILHLSHLIFEEIRGYIMTKQPIPENKNEFGAIIRRKYEQKFKVAETAYRKILSETLWLVRKQFLRARNRARKTRHMIDLYVQGTTFKGLPPEALANRNHTELKLIAGLFVAYLVPKKRGLR